MLLSSPRTADPGAPFLHRHAHKLAIGVLLLYVGIVLIFNSHFKLPWGDESLTYYSIHGRTLAGLLHFQSTTPIVLEPPANELVTWACAKVFGYSIWALRLPSIVFFLLLEWLVYRLAQFLGGFRSGILAAAILAGSLILDYGTEARPYAMLTAFAALVLVLWTDARSQEIVRKRPLILLALTIAAATLSQFYGAMIVLPVGVAELTLSIRRRRAPSLSVSIAIAAGLSAVILLLPFVRAVHSIQSHLAVQGSFGIVQFFETYDWGFISRPNILAWHGHRFWFWTAPLLVYAAVASFPKPYRSANSESPVDVQRALWAGLVALMLYPVPVLLLARFVVHIYAPRYAIQCIVGLVVLLGVALAKLLDRATARQIAAVVVLGSIVLTLRDAEIVGHRYKLSKGVLRDYATSQPVRDLLAQNPQIPIFLTIDECLVYPFYGDQAYTSRIRCIYSVPLEEEYLHTLMSSTTTLVLGSRTDFPLKVSSYEAMRAQGSVLLAYRQLAWLKWIPSAMAADRARTADVGSGFGGEVMEVTYPQNR